MVKNLYFIGGPMGVGKTAVCELLNKKLPNCVWLDGDWCWKMDPFKITDETKTMVIDNICHLLQNFINCSQFENIVFCWVLHQQTIIDNMLSKLDTKHCKIFCISLLASKSELQKRLIKDIEKGQRSMDIIQKSMERLPSYDSLNTIKINTDCKKIEQIAQSIIDLKITA